MSDPAVGICPCKKKNEENRREKRKVSLKKCVWKHTLKITLFLHVRRKKVKRDSSRN